MQQVLRQFAGESAPKPKRLTDIDQFSKMYYDSMIKVEYEKDFAAAKALFKDNLSTYHQNQLSKEGDQTEGQTEGDGTADNDVESAEEPKRPVAVNVRRLTTYRLWKAQTDEFRAQVKERADDAHKEAIAEWEEQKKCGQPKSAEQYDR